MHLRLHSKAKRVCAKPKAQSVGLARRLHPASSSTIATISIALTMTLLQLGLCAGSIYTTFLIWGLLQERREYALLSSQIGRAHV